MKRFIRRPSPALVISCIALFSSLGGVSYGLATGVIDGREIKDRSITNKDFKTGTLRGNEAKPDGFGGGAIKESTLGTVPTASSVASTAVVSAPGALVRGRGVAAVARTAVGRYEVAFGGNVQGCVYVATVGDEGVAGPGNGQTAVGGSPTNANAVVIRTSNADGMRADRSFHVMVSC